MLQQLHRWFLIAVAIAAWLRFAQNPTASTMRSAIIATFRF